MVIQSSNSLKRPRPDWRKPLPLPLRKHVKRNVPVVEVDVVEVDDEETDNHHLLLRPRHDWGKPLPLPLKKHGKRNVPVVEVDDEESDNHHLLLRSRHDWRKPLPLPSRKHFKRNVPIIEVDDEESDNHHLLLRSRHDWRKPLPLPLRKYEERNVPVVEVDDEESDNHHLIKGRRSWEDMDYDILVSILKRLGVHMLIVSTCLVSKSWLNATLDALFPPNHVFSLNDYHLLTYDCPPSNMKRNWLWTLFQFHLNRNLPPHYYTKLLLYSRILTISSYRFIAQRLPFITSLSINIGLSKLLKFRDFASCWKGLVEVECVASCVHVIGSFWNQIHTLKLQGEIKVQDANSIANDFPCLTHLTLSLCKLSSDALSLILEGQKNLTYLDMTHTCVGKTRDPNYWDGELLLKANKIPQFLKCEIGNCGNYCILP